MRIVHTPENPQSTIRVLITAKPEEQEQLYNLIISMQHGIQHYGDYYEVSEEIQNKTTKELQTIINKLR